MSAVLKKQTQVENLKESREKSEKRMQPQMSDCAALASSLLSPNHAEPLSQIPMLWLMGILPVH